MRRSIIVLTILFFASVLQAGPIQQWHSKIVKSRGGTNYTAHANCVGAWYLTATGSTSETDQSGEGYTFQVSTDDTIPSSATVPSGYSGASRDFEFSDVDYLYISDASATKLDINGADAKITICAWIKPETVPGTGADAAIVTKYGNSGYRQYYLILRESSGSVYARFAKSNDGSTVTGVSGTTDIQAGTWYHVCGVYDDVNAEIWVNGTREAYSASTTGIYDTGCKFMIGAIDTDGSGADSFFDGLIDEVIVFNVGLNSTQINEIKTHGMSGNKGSND